MKHQLKIIPSGNLNIIKGRLNSHIQRIQEFKRNLSSLLSLK